MALINFPSPAVVGQTYTFAAGTSLEKRYIFKAGQTGASDGYWAATGGNIFNPATAAEIDAGTEIEKYIAPDQLALSDYDTITERNAALVRNVYKTSAIGVALDSTYKDVMEQTFTTGPTGKVNVSFFATVFYTGANINITYTRLEVRKGGVLVGVPSHLNLQAGDSNYPRQTVAQSIAESGLLPNTQYSVVLIAQNNAGSNTTSSIEGMTFSGLTW